MSMQIHCPQCGVRLDVPEQAGGRSARCPRCKAMFRVPDTGKMLDETVACWLNLDQLDDDEDDDEQQAQAQPGAPADAAGAASPTPPASAAPADGGEQLVEPAPAEGESSPAEPQPKGRGSYVIDAEQMAKLKRSGAFVAPDPNQIKLHVLKVGAFGVKFAFPARLLDNAAFRASMPMRGIVSGETEPSHLTARPLAWVDKATGHRVDPDEIEGRYEMRVRGHESTRAVVESMSMIQELPAPFNLPMPYYVSKADFGKAEVHCETVSGPYGVQCEVSIPSMHYALDWLGRVNGICGEEYGELAKQVEKYDSAAWRQIPLAVRGRLSVWFDFEPDEQFVAYFNDSDYSSSDAGLGGLIVTTGRLVYCKFHHQGSIDMSAGGTLLATPSGGFVNLSFRRNGGRRKLIRMRLTDLDQLAQVLNSLGSPVQLQIEDAPASAATKSKPTPR